MVPDTPGVAHAAGGDDDMKAGELGDRLALLDRFGEPELRRVQEPAHIDRGIEARCVLAKDFGGADRQRRIQEDRGGRHLAAFHQVDQVDDELLGALHRERRNQQRALAARGVADLRGEPRAARIRRDRRTLAIAIGRFRDDVVEACRRLGIGLQQFGVRADVAGRKDAQRFPDASSSATFDLDRGGAEQMPGVPVARANAGNDVDPFFVVDRRERLQRGDRIGLRIDRS